MVIELFTGEFNFAVMLKLLTQFSLVFIVFVFHIFIVSEKQLDSTLLDWRF